MVTTASDRSAYLSQLLYCMPALLCMIQPQLTTNQEQYTHACVCPPTERGSYKQKLPTALHLCSVQTCESKRWESCHVSRVPLKNRGTCGGPGDRMLAAPACMCRSCRMERCLLPERGALSA